MDKKTARLKGISPLVAVILLIAFTLVVAGILAGWATQFAQQQQHGIQYCLDAKVFIYSGNYETGNVNLVVYNNGEVDLTFKTLLSYSNGSVVIYPSTNDVDAGQIETFTLSDPFEGNFTDLTEVTIQSERCPGAQDFLEKRNIDGLT